jgi:hypothetical protein
MASVERLACIQLNDCTGIERIHRKVTFYARKYFIQRRRWDDRIRMDFRKFGWVERVWTGFDCLRIGAGGELLCAVMNLRVLAPPR